MCYILWRSQPLRWSCICNREDIENNLVSCTWKTRKTRTKVTERIFQCKLIPRKIFWGISIIEKSMLFQVYKKNCQKWADSINKYIQNSNSINKKFKSASTRTTTKTIKCLSPIKRNKRKHFSSPAKQCLTKKGLQSFSPVSPTSSVSLLRLGSPTSTNKALFGSECGLCKIVELRTKGKYLVTTTDAAAGVN